MAPFFMPGVLIGSRSLKLTGGAYNRAEELFIFIKLFKLLVKLSRESDLSSCWRPFRFRSSCCIAYTGKQSAPALSFRQTI